MKWKFRKDFQLIPGIKLSYGKSGIATEFTAPLSIESDALQLEKLKYKLNKPYAGCDEIKSANIHQLTSENLKEFRDLLQASAESFEETGLVLTLRQNKRNAKEERKVKLERNFFRFFLRKR
jgi:hypothetical protein